MLKRILTAVLMLVVLLVVNSAGASNTVRIAYSDIDNFVGIKDGRLAGYGVALFDAIAEYTGWTYEYKSGSWEQCLEWVKPILLFQPSTASSGRRISFSAGRTVF